MKRLSRISFAALLGILPLLLVPRVATRPALRCMGKTATIVGTRDGEHIRGTPGRDVIIGLGGNDQINGRNGDDYICGNGGYDSLLGGGGNDRLMALIQADFMAGGRGNDRMFSKGRSVMQGGPGNDLYQGGDGPLDVASFAKAQVGVAIDLAISGPQDTGEGIDTLIAIDALLGSPGNDVLDGHDAPNPIRSLDGLGGSDLLLGGAGGVSIYGGEGADELHGGDGDDRLFGEYQDPPSGERQRFGDDSIHGGDGKDFLSGGGAGDHLYGDAGDDEIYGDWPFVPFSTNDFGDGGTNDTASPGDRCFQLEEAINCETQNPRR